MLLTWKPDPEPHGERKARAGAYRASVYLARKGGWYWSAADPELPHSYVADGRIYPTERAARLACEAALLRLGVLPLPEWHQTELAWRLDVGNHAWANAAASDDGPWWEWSVYAHPPAHSPCGGETRTPDDAKRIAEGVLCAEMAAWLDAQAATEEA